MGLDEQFRIIKGTNHTYLLTFTREEDITDDNPEGRVDLTGATIHYRWKLHVECQDDAVLVKSSGDAAEITKLAQTGDTLGQAEVYLVPDDTLSLVARTYDYDAWAVLSDSTRHASIEPSEITLEESVTDLSGSPPAAVGTSATQDTRERSFKFTWPSDTDSATVTIPGAGMFNAVYSVSAIISDIPAGEPLATLYALETGRTVTTFVLDASGTLAQDTVIDVIVRDNA